MRRSALTLQRRRAGGLVFDRRSGQFSRVGVDDLDLLEQLRLAPAVDVVTASPDPVAARARVQTWATLGVFTGRGHLDAELLPPAPDGVDDPEPPLLVHLEIHGRCTLRCRHCFAGELPHRDEPLGRDDLDALFAELARLGALRLALSGGEPLLRPDLLEVVDVAAGHGLFPTLTTNGLHIDDDVAAALAARLDDGRLGWLSVSLEGKDAASTDDIRGAGVFDEVIERLSWLRAHEAPFSLAFTVRPAIVDEVAACVALAREVGAVGAIFRPLYPTGLARRDPSLWLTRAQWERARERLRHAADDGVAIDVGDDDVVGVEASTCGAGRTQASISLSGRMSPCGFLGSDFDGPSVREHGFWPLWRDATVFARVRDAAADRAGGYDGGCRVRALATTGSASGPDPWRWSPSSPLSVSTRRGRGLPVLEGP
jgi:MoaA/NifB/PqqE/SkfB family radical SAM enzyme